MSNLQTDKSDMQTLRSKGPMEWDLWVLVLLFLLGTELHPVVVFH